ncbi:hypothetical protein WNY61_09135 [Sulfitobacter sp. AS92]|uniref:hypothetical protein n=1 Tax=Sulfitobacter sp. AS92 TaxID=3135783 RepID=UPI003181FDEE
MSRQHQAAIMVRMSQSQAAFGVHRCTLYRWAAAGHIKIYRRGPGASFVDPMQVKAFIMGLGDTVGDKSPYTDFSSMKST